MRREEESKGDKSRWKERRGEQRRVDEERGRTGKEKNGEERTRTDTKGRLWEPRPTWAQSGPIWPSAGTCSRMASRY